MLMVFTRDSDKQLFGTKPSRFQALLKKNLAEKEYFRACFQTLAAAERTAVIR